MAAKSIDASKSGKDAAAKDLVTYLISVKTGDVKKVGNVFLAITGNKGVIEKALKENKAKKTPFEKGKLDEFEISGMDVGTISKIHIGHDGKGWFLETVSIKKGNQTFNFSANRWLDEKEGDKKRSVDLTPDKAGDAKKQAATTAPAPSNKAPANQRSVSQGPPAAQPSQNKTPAQSQAKPAQTNAKSESKTATSQSQSNKQAPATTTKPGAQPAGGKPAAAQSSKTTPPAATAQKSTAASVIVNSSTNKGGANQPVAGKQTQPAATKPAPPQNSKAGPAANSKPAASSTNNKSQDAKAKSTSLPPTQNRPQAQPSQSNAKVPYKITIKTADELGAGTDAKISIKIAGTKGSTGEMFLDDKVFSGKKGKNIFEKGNTDEFTIQAADVGQVTQVVISQDGKKLGAAWKIDTVKVETKSDSETWKVNRWLDKDTKDSKLELKTTKKISDASKQQASTPPSQAKKPEPAKTTPAANNNKAQPTPKASKSSSSPPPPAASNKNKTAPTSSTPPPPSKVAKSSASPAPTTSKASKSSSSPPPPSSKDSASNSKSSMSSSTQKQPPKTSQDAKQAAGSKDFNNNNNNKNSAEYKIAIKTGNDLGAGTDSKVTIRLIGTKGTTGDLLLDEKNATKKSKNCFERGSLDEFAVQAADVGQVTQVNISQDGAKVASKWQVEYVKVDSKNETETWTINKWVDKEVVELKSTRKVKDANQKPKSSAREDASAAKKPAAAEKSASNLDDSLTRKKPVMERRNNMDTSRSTAKTAASSSDKPHEDYHHVELRRLKDQLTEESHRIQFPKRREYHPYVFNDLSPYYNIKDVENLVNAPDNMAPVGYYNRYTAMGIVEPWVAHRMESGVPPTLTRSLTQNITTSRNHAQGLNTSTTGPGGEKRVYEGSTLAPNFPKVNIVKSKDAKGPFSFNDVPVIRREMKRNLTNQRRFEEDRNRTINDYYRMHLDQTAEKDKMIEAYHAYLESTPGSKKALEELLNNNKSVKIELVPIDGSGSGGGGGAKAKNSSSDANTTNSANVTPRTPTSDGGGSKDKSMAGGSNNNNNNNNKVPVASNA